MVVEHLTDFDGRATHAQYYVAYDGDYSMLNVLDDKSGRDYYATTPERLGVEAFLGQHIGRLLEQSPDPVVVMDVGAAAAMSVMRLARQYETQVQNSRLAFVATNADLRIADFIDELDTKHQEAVDLFGTRQIHEITTDFTTGPKTITLPDGTKIDLRDNVDLVHERLSVTAWNKDPNPQIRRIGDLLSPRSLYMVPFYDIEHRQPDSRRRPANTCQEAHSALDWQKGIRPVYACEAGAFAGRTLSYLMFKGPESPLIRMDSTQSAIPETTS